MTLTALCIPGSEKVTNNSSSRSFVGKLQEHVSSLPAECFLLVHHLNDQCPPSASCQVRSTCSNPAGEATCRNGYALKTDALQLRCSTAECDSAADLALCCEVCLCVMSLMHLSLSCAPFIHNMSEHVISSSTFKRALWKTPELSIRWLFFFLWLLSPGSNSVLVACHIAHVSLIYERTN